MHLAPLIHDLAIILGVAGLTTYIFRKIKQPVVLGYLVAGLLIGPHTPPFPLVSDLPNIQTWAELGVIFVMFSLGLDFSFRKLMRVGKSASVTALGQVIVMLVLGYGAGRLLGWNLTDCFFLGGMLAISSTTIIFKAFDELGLRTRHFAEQVFGILIVEDLVAIVLMVGLTIVSTTQTVWDVSILIAAVRLIVVVGGWFLVGYFVIPTFFRRIGRWMDEETWVVLSVGLCLLLVVTGSYLGYSPALGAFIMGSILAETREASRIEHLIRPLRDLFAAVFFVSVGMLVDPKALSEHGMTVLILTVVTILGKIVGVTFTSLLTGQSLRSSIRAGFSLAQIGEFSFIIATLGSQLQVTSDFLFPVAVAVCTITTFTTPYLIRLSLPVADALEKWLPRPVQVALAEYEHRLKQPKGVASSGAFFQRRFIRFLLNGILVTTGFFVLGSLVLPELQTRFPNVPALLPLSWLCSVLLTAPFVWGMFFAFRDPTREGRARANILPSFFAHITTLAWVGLLSATFFDTAIPYLLTLCTAMVFFFLFYRRLGGAYWWFEGRLVENLKGATEAHVQSLVPWDLHLYKVLLHPNSSLAGETLATAQVRQQYGVNIVAVQRGDRSFAAPPGDELLHPLDTLLVLGTEEGVEAFKAACESNTPKDAESKDLADYRLDRILIDAASSYLGKTIQSSGIRENLGALIVGLENGAVRTTNPKPDRKLVEGDVLWVVTDR